MTDKFSRWCGEHLVCAEALRQGLVATTFSGNMEVFDIITYYKDNKVYKKVQVKTTTRKYKKDETWVFGKADEWLKFDEKLLSKNPKIQYILGKQEREDKDIMFVFVLKGTKYGEDRFFILTQPEVQDIVYNRYTGKCRDEYEGKKVLIRDHMRIFIHLFQLEPHENKWEKLRK